MTIWLILGGLLLLAAAGWWFFRQGKLSQFAKYVNAAARVKEAQLDAAVNAPKSKADLANRIEKDNW